LGCRRGDRGAVARGCSTRQHIAEMDLDAEFDGSLGRQAGVAHDHAVLDLDCAPHLVDHTAKFDEEPVAGALDHAPMMRGGRTLGSINPWKRRGRQRAQMPVPPRSEVRIPSAPPASPDQRRWFPRLRNLATFNGLAPSSAVCDGDLGTVSSDLRYVQSSSAPTRIPGEETR
jgi:hypothetical protein